MLRKDQMARSKTVLSRRRQACACIRMSRCTRGILPNSRVNSFTQAVRSPAWPPIELMPFTCGQDCKLLQATTLCTITQCISLSRSFRLCTVGQWAHVEAFNLSAGSREGLSPVFKNSFPCSTDVQMFQLGPSAKDGYG